MGYYADGSGSIRFARQLTQDEHDRVYEALNEVFEVWQSTPPKESVFDFYSSEKYNDDIVLEALNSAAQVAPIADGEIDYVGEDGCFWRFIFRGGVWDEENGRIIYESEPGYYSQPQKPIQADESWEPNDKDACECLY
jgi:hypothetical protein